MGTPGFNLQQSIDSYINSIAQQGSITGADEAELKSHLQDTAEGLQKHGLNAEEAFIIACKRLGNEELLTDEYSKVNPSVNTNKLWAYLIIGGNLFFSLPTVIFALVVLFYQLVFNYFQFSNTAALIVTVFHLLLIIGVGYIVSNKNNIANYIENSVKTNALRTTLLSFLPLLFPARTLLLPQGARNFPGISFDHFPLYNFHNTAVEFSGYLLILVIVAGLASLVFSINKIDMLSLKLVFEKPSVLFLVIFGVIVEVLAACTRVLPSNNMAINALLFGMIYMGAAYLLSYYNKQGSVNRYLFTFSVFGICMEIIGGIIGDINKHFPHYTTYIIIAIIISVIAGRFLGMISGRKNVIA